MHDNYILTVLNKTVHLLESTAYLKNTLDLQPNSMSGLMQPNKF